MQSWSPQRPGGQATSLCSPQRLGGQVTRSCPSVPVGRWPVSGYPGVPMAGNSISGSVPVSVFFCMTMCAFVCVLFRVPTRMFVNVLSEYSLGHHSVSVGR